MEHTHKISPVDVHNGPGTMDSSHSLKRDMKASPALGIILEVYSWHIYSQTQYETRDSPWN